MGLQELIDQYRANVYRFNSGNVTGQQPPPAQRGGYLDSGAAAPTPTPPPPAETKPTPTASSAPAGAVERAASTDINSPGGLGEMFASFVNNLDQAKQGATKAILESKPAQKVGLLGEAAKTVYRTLPQPVQTAGDVVGRGVGLLGDALSYTHPDYEKSVGGPGILEAITPMAGKAAGAAKAVGSIANLNRAQAVNAARDIAIKSGARRVAGVQHLEKYFTSIGDDVTANAMRMLQEDMVAGKVSLTAAETAGAASAPARSVGSAASPLEPVPPVTEPPLTPVRGAEAFAGEARPALDALSLGDDVVRGTALESIARASRGEVYNLAMKDIPAGTKVVIGGKEFVAKAEGTRGAKRFVDGAGNAVDNATNVRLVGYAGSDFAGVAARNPGKTIYKISYTNNTGGKSSMWGTLDEVQPIVRSGRGEMVKSVRVPSAGAEATMTAQAGAQRVQGTIGATRPVPPATPEAVAAEAAAKNSPLGLDRAKQWFSDRSKVQKGLLGTAGAGVGAAAMSPLADNLSAIGADARMRSKDPSLTRAQQLAVGGFGNIMSGAGAASSLAGTGVNALVDLFTKPVGEIQEELKKNPERARQFQDATGQDLNSPKAKEAQVELEAQGANTPEGQERAMTIAVSDLTNLVVDGKSDDEIDKYMGNTFVGTLSKLIFGDTKKWWLFMALGMGIGAAAGAEGRRDVIDRIMGAFYAAPMVGLKEIRSAQKEPTGKMYILTDPKGNNKIVRDSDFNKIFKNGIIPTDIKIRSLDGSGESSSNLLALSGQMTTRLARDIDVAKGHIKTLRENLDEMISDPTLVDTAFRKQTNSPEAIYNYLVEKSGGVKESREYVLAKRIKEEWWPLYHNAMMRLERLNEQYGRVPSFP